MSGKVSEKHPSKGAGREKWIENIRAARIGAPVAKRFWAKVEKTDACWVWQGSTDEGGYGMFRPEGRRGPTVRAHRWALIRKLRRPLRLGLKACHKCDNPSCVRGAHLYEGTSKENAQDREERGRSNRATGERHGMAKLPDVQVDELRQLARSGVRKAVLARRFGISKSTAGRIVEGKVRA